MNAWQELSQTEYGDVWTRFERQFRFRPSVSRWQWPGIREPSPSITYDISIIYGDAVRYTQEEADLNLRMLAALRRCVGPQRRLYALDWQHTSYWFYPHIPFDSANPDAWLVPVLPNGDYYIFLGEDFEFGLFGHPWEQTICVFGHDLLHAVRQAQPSLLRKALRSNLPRSPVSTARPRQGGE